MLFKPPWYSLVVRAPDPDTRIRDSSPTGRGKPVPG